MLSVRSEPEHLDDAELRVHFEAALDLRREDRPVNLVTLRGLTEGDPLGGASIAERLAAVSFDGVPPTPRDMADALIDLAHRRELKALGEQVAGSVLNMAMKPAALAEMVMRECDRLLAAAQPAGQTYWPPPDAMNEALARIGRDDGADRLMTGLADLDRKTGGLHRRRRSTWRAGRRWANPLPPVVIAVNVAKAGHGVLYISLEMTLEQLEARIASASTYGDPSPIAYDRALNGQLSYGERERFIRAGSSRSLLPIAIEERPSLSTAEIAARVRKTKQEFAGQGRRLGLVIVDHVGKIRPRDPRAPLVQQIGQISNDLVALAKSEDVAMLALHQLNRGVEQRENKRPGLADLRDSGNLEQDADGVWLLYRPAYYLQRGEDGEDAKAALQRKQTPGAEEALAGNHRRQEP